MNGRRIAAKGLGIAPVVMTLSRSSPTQVGLLTSPTRSGSTTSLTGSYRSCACRRTVDAVTMPGADHHSTTAPFPLLAPDHADVAAYVGSHACRPSEQRV